MPGEADVIALRSILLARAELMMAYPVSPLQCGSQSPARGAFA
jgi:hypothetical protein